LRAPRRKAIPKTRYRLDAQSPVPLFEQLYQQVRNEILAGRLRPGDKLPSSRTWAERLGVSRTTVLTSLDQLHAEGYIQSRRATEVRVANTLPDDSLRRAPGDARHARIPPIRPRLPSSAVVWPQPRNYGTPKPFQMAVPAIDSFPARDWGQLSSVIWRQPPLELLNYHRPGGYPKPVRTIFAGKSSTNSSQPRSNPAKRTTAIRPESRRKTTAFG
jgi:GntR family transcriptional regulator/MocR family aminotransferase